VRRLALLAVLALGVAACGGGSGTDARIDVKWGTKGGTMVPVSYDVAPSGAVKTSGSHATAAITTVEEAKLSSLVRAAFRRLKSEQCRGSFPDESSMFITALGRTVTVRGSCEPKFTWLYGELMAVASALRSSPPRA